MIDRYCLPKMKEIWEQTSKFGYYLDVELAVCEAYNRLGKIPNENLDFIKRNVKFDIARINEIEQEVKHDFIAFLTSLNESLDKENASYLHVGLTSSDVIDTALSLQIKDSGKIILEDLDKLIKSLRNLALKHKHTICMGRSHGVHAEIMTFGIKVLSWLDAFERAKVDCEYVLEELKVGQISGPIGTYSNVLPDVENITCEILGLRPAKISTQVLPRDYHARVFGVLAIIASLVERFATEIRHLQRTEVRELEEGFGVGQKGSSAMPHKKNPILCENLCGLARVIRSNLQASLDNIALWHERDMSHSSVERVTFPDSFILVDFMLNRFNDVVENLHVIEKNMSKNCELYGGIVFSQSVLLKLTELGYSREDAYRIVQKHALDALDNGTDFKSNLLNDIELTDYKKLLESCFDKDAYLRNIDTIFERFL